MALVGVSVGMLNTASLYPLATLLSVVLLLGACETHTETQARMSTEIRYIKDHRTGLCFAHYERGYGEVLATVPCDVVEDYLPPGTK